MKQTRERARWKVRLVALAVAMVVCVAPILATPITEPDDGDDSTPSVCVMSTRDMWVYRVSERLRRAGLLSLRLRFVFTFLENGRYECTG